MLIETGLVPPTDAVAAHFGAQPLEPEESTNVTLGLGWNSPGGLSVTTDFFWIEVQDRLAGSDNITICTGMTITEANSATECPAGGHLFGLRTIFTAFQLSNPGLRNGSQISFYTNSWDTETQGVELVASWDSDLGALGTTGYTLAASHIETEVTSRDVTTISDRRHHNVANLLPETRIVLTANQPNGCVALYCARHLLGRLGGGGQRIF